MTFGKPKLSSKLVRCTACGEEYPEHQLLLKHAGRIDAGPNAGDYWNSKCPECGAVDQLEDVE